MIPVIAKVVYSHRTVTVLVDGKVNSTFSHINSFHSFNEFDGVISFFGDLIGNETISLRGFGSLTISMSKYESILSIIPGVLLISNNIAYYVLFGADPRVCIACFIHMESFLLLHNCSFYRVKQRNA